MNNLIDRFFKLMVDRGASDMHFSVGRPPIFRSSGRIEPIRFRVFDDAYFTQLVEPITPAHLWEEYVRSGDVDYAYEVEGLARFRCNLFKQERGMGAVFRVIPSKILTLETLRMPKAVHNIVDFRSGLMLVTGPTGSGKSTTLAAIINEINATRKMHIVTLEDPIEFVHQNQMSLVSQREVHNHSRSFRTALKSAVREDPDLILVGEMRDQETIEMALSAAETGLLVFGTLHTNSAAKTMDRIINVFPSDRQETIRNILASVLKGVVSQQLLRRKGGGRVAAVEILFCHPGISSLIRQDKTYQIPGAIQQGVAMGMIGMDASLRRLVEDDVIETSAALEKALDKDEFRNWLKERGVDVPDDVELPE
ncbi:MAG: type IV pilus twitching motility protein PilT [Deltaproteobacteria bacterium]|nr:MAG: type IV pilus twitching motility protein PilT [Deltaproteobacteria bacterium]